MKFRIKIANKGEEKNWRWEEYDEDVSDPEEWAKETLEVFNSSLRPFEKERVLLGVELIDEMSVRAHTWNKTNLMTLHVRGQYFDTVECTRCGITGKRHGVGDVKVDSKFKSKVYARCDTAKKHLDKKRAREAEK